jgi:hypothetical protein
MHNVYKAVCYTVIEKRNIIIIGSTSQYSVFKVAYTTPVIYY